MIRPLARMVADVLRHYCGTSSEPVAVLVERKGGRFAARI
jgi:hypothetical protein